MGKAAVKECIYNNGYQHGYRKAVEEYEERKEKNRRKAARRKAYKRAIIKQRLVGTAIIAGSIALAWLLNVEDVTYMLLTVPMGLLLIFTKEIV